MELGLRLSGVDYHGRRIFLADAHRSDGKLFVVHADEKLTAFVFVEPLRTAKTDRQFGVAELGRKLLVETASLSQNQSR